ncbi:MAG TPA: ATP-binding protein [Acidimicrobiales bacterium]|nr:ATP-binding protein [Acidimicrobiales bacterium]
MSAHDLVALLLMAASASAVAALVGAGLARGTRRRPVRTQALVIAAAAVVSTLVGVIFAAEEMFISAHDLKALLVVLGASAAVGLGAAAQLGSQLERNAASVRDLARRIGAGESDHGVDRLPPAAPEFTQLAEEVVDLPRRLEELRQRAESLEQSRRDLVAWVSHDLRSPLATIRAMAEALDDGIVSDAETTARYHLQIRRDAERLSALVDDLFELSRIHSGVHEMRRECVVLNAVVADAVASQLERAERRGVRLVDEGAGADNHAEVEVAVPELSRVLHNVIDNAIRHTPAGGVVVVRVDAADGCATVSVQDQCGGIPEADLERVFDVAFRGDAARGKGEQGGGLGLAIAKGLVEACAGAIDVDNVRSGCRFTVTLPLRG